MKTIMVQMRDRQWTMRALHLACAMARDHHTEVVMVRFVYAQHPSWLGTEMVDIIPCDQDQQDMCEYIATAEDYGVKLSIAPMHYTTLAGAIADAADAVAAEVVFANIPETHVPYWRKLQMWSLERQFAARQRQLYTLEQPDETPIVTPAVTTGATR
jgi:hypothetical protein